MDAADPWNPGDPRNKHRTRRMQAGIRQLLLEWDPIGVAGIPETEDEYDCLISPLHHRLYAGATVEQITDYLAQEMRGHFGLKPRRKGMTSFVEGLWQWWTDQTTRAVE
jgi:hypothetical protein